MRRVGGPRSFFTQTECDSTHHEFRLLLLLHHVFLLALQVSTAQDLSLFGFLKVIHIRQDISDGGSNGRNGFVYAGEEKDREAVDIHL